MDDDAILPPDLLWHSVAPWNKSAYGIQTEMVVASLASAGYRIDLSVLLATSGPLDVGGHRVWPADDLSGRALRRNADAVFGAGQAGRAVVFTDVERLGTDPWGSIDVALWVPVGFDPVPPSYVERLAAGGARVLAMSRWGQEALAACDVPSTYIPHGVDRTVFRPPTAEERARGRESYGVPSDAFVAGMVAVNNEWPANRKNIPEAIMAFAELRRERTDAVLLLHMDTSTDMGGIDVGHLIEGLGLPRGSVVATHPNHYRLGRSTEEMARTYWALDVLLAPSAAEGFGLPVIEAQACGVPVIVSDFSVQPELVGAGWVVGGQRRWAPWERSWCFTPDVREIRDALVEAHAHGPGSRPAAVEMAARYDHDAIVRDRWLPFIESWIGQPVQK